ncbi:OmpP1/FadL family transporter [Parasalinivibrio latis]|uniref:outer membrane protein transport protein n=1 Tax=Parasalinivibrio latis TaxID=2952610 RepID=UPI0030DE7EEC
MKKTLSRTLISSAVALAAFQAQGAGFQVAEQSASGLGRAYAGEAAIGDNAAAMIRNPALMSRFSSPALSVAAHYVAPEVDVTNDTAKEEAKDVAPSALVPAAAYIHPIDNQLAVGIALFTNYGVATDYPNDFLAGSSAGDTSLKTVTLNPSVSYQINEQLSIGGGINFVYAEAELTRYKGDTSLAAPPAGFGGNRNDKLIYMEGNTTAWGWNIGALYEVNEKHRYGISYRSKVDLDFDGDFTDYTGVITQKPKVAVDASLAAPMPAIIEASGYNQLSDQFAIHYSVFWTQWSDFTELKASSSANCKGPKAPAPGVCFNKKEEYDDAFRYSIGTTYIYSDSVTLRAGFAFDEQGGKSTLSIPDTDRYWYSIGATYKASEKSTFDFGFAYLNSKKISFKEASASQQVYDFTSEGHAFILGAQFNYAF